MFAMHSVLSITFQARIQKIFQGIQPLTLEGSDPTKHYQSIRIEDTVFAVFNAVFMIWDRM